jgi:anti-anti-sigma factor
MDNAVSSSAGSSGEFIFVINGELDIATRDAIPILVRDAITSTTVDIGLDLSGVDFIDCAGLAGILQARKLAVEHGCRVHVAAASPAVHRLLQLTDTTAALIEK